MGVCAPTFASLGAKRKNLLSQLGKRDKVKRTRARTHMGGQVEWKDRCGKRGARARTRQKPRGGLGEHRCTLERRDWKTRALKCQAARSFHNAGEAPISRDIYTSIETRVVSLSIETRAGWWWKMRARGITHCYQRNVTVQRRPNKVTGRWSDVHSPPCVISRGHAKQRRRAVYTVCVVRRFPRSLLLRDLFYAELN